MRPPSKDWSTVSWSWPRMSRRFSYSVRQKKSDSGLPFNIGVTSFVHVAHQNNQKLTKL